MTQLCTLCLCEFVDFPRFALKGIVPQVCQLNSYSRVIHQIHIECDSWCCIAVISWKCCESDLIGFDLMRSLYGKELGPKFKFLLGDIKFVNNPQLTKVQRKKFNRLI